MIEFKPGNYYSTLWFIPFEKMDVMGCLWKPLTLGAKWIMRYRFRYYKSDDPFDTTDEKNWYELQMDGATPEGEIRDKLNAMLRLLASVHPRWLKEYYDVPIKGDFKQALRILKQQPWAHIETREGTEEEKEQWERGKVDTVN